MHGTAETFLIIVEDINGEVILFNDTFVLHQRYAEEKHNVTLSVPMFEPVPPITTFRSSLIDGCMQ